MKIEWLDALWLQLFEWKFMFSLFVQLLLEYFVSNFLYGYGYNGIIMHVTIVKLKHL